MTIEKQLVRAKARIEILERMVEDKTRELYVEQLELKNAHDYLHRIINGMINPLFVTDARLMIVDCNRAAEILLGRDEDEMRGSELCSLLAIKGICAPAEGQCEMIGDFYTEEIFLATPDGKMTPLLVSLSNLRNEAGEFSGLVCVASNMTKYKELERQLAQAQKLESVGQLAAGIAHEINTPIQYVRDNTDFLTSEFAKIIELIEVHRKLVGSHVDDTSDQQSEMAHKAKRKADEVEIEYLIEEIPKALRQTLQGANQVANIVQSMKLFSHPGQKEKLSCDLNKTLESAVIVSKSEWKYVAEVELALDPKLPFIECFPSQLGQAFLNLVVNAAHAVADNSSEGKGSIRISTKPAGDTVIVEIADTGTGIPADIRDKIFDPFFTTKDVGKGTGQGLALVYSTIVEVHGGTIAVESEVERGTKFIISLPSGTVSQSNP